MKIGKVKKPPANTLYTIGHSTHSIEKILRILKDNRLDVLVDVRSSPHSQHVSHFNREAMKQVFSQNSIKYMFLGKELGARRGEESSYVDGRAPYDRIAQLPLFAEGIERVIKGIRNYRIVLMCSEAEPLDCHRTLLVCRELVKQLPKLKIEHILKDGRRESHESAMLRLVDQLKLKPNLFEENNSLEGLINRAYEVQSEKIEYQR